MLRPPRPLMAPDTITVLAQLVARMATETIEIGREFGYQYPLAYDVGFTLAEDDDVPGLCRCQVRINDQRHRFVATYSLLDKGDGFMAELERGASTCVHLWADRHPEYKPTAQRAHAAVAQMTRERCALGEDGHAERVAQAARARMLAARFELRATGLDV